MARLNAQFSPAFQRDVKRMKKKHIDDQPLAEVIDLIIENSPQALDKLRNRHNMHILAENGKEAQSVMFAMREIGF